MSARPFTRLRSLSSQWESLANSSRGTGTRKITTNMSGSRPAIFARDWSRGPMADPSVSIIEEDASRVFAAANLRDLEGKSVLITGASGLIGIHLLACLRELSKHASAPAKVTAVAQSELSSAFREISDFKGARVVMGDLTDLEFTSGLGRFEFIVHAAG